MLKNLGVHNLRNLDGRQYFCHNCVHRWDIPKEPQHHYWQLSGAGVPSAISLRNARAQFHCQCFDMQIQKLYKCKDIKKSPL